MYINPIRSLSAPYRHPMHTGPGLESKRTHPQVHCCVSMLFCASCIRPIQHKAALATYKENTGR